MNPVSPTPAISVPDDLAALIDRVLETDPQSDSHQPRAIGITPEIVNEIHRLGEADVEALVNLYVLFERPMTHNHERAWATKQLVSHAGAKAIPFVVKAFGAETNDWIKWSLVGILGDIGEPATEALYDILIHTDEFHVASSTVTAFFKIGLPAVRPITIALEYPEAAISNSIINNIREYRAGGNVPLGLVESIATHTIEELIVRRDDLPYSFNDQVVARCLMAAIERTPQLRRRIQNRLCELAFQDEGEVRERVLQVARNLDLDDFVQLVRAKAAEYPDATQEILYQLGKNEPLPVQRRSLANYTGQLEDLEKRSLARWDEMARQSKFNFWMRNVLTAVYFLAGLAVIGFGIYLVVVSGDPVKQGIGGFVSLFTAIGGMLTRFWQAPVADIREAFRQQAGVETTFIGFMTRAGQIRLLFEQSFSKGEVSIEALEKYQKMIADAQAQTAHELALTKTESGSKA